MASTVGKSQYYGATSTSLKVSTGLQVRKVGNEYRAKAFGGFMLENMGRPGAEKAIREF